MSSLTSSLAKARRIRPRRPAAHTRAFVGDIQARVAAGELEHAHALARGTHRLIPDSAVIADLLVATREARGFTASALDLARENAARHLDWLRRRPTAAHGPVAPSQRIFLSGFFYSGSGAVLDFLGGLEGTARWAPGDEIRLIRSPGGVAEVVTTLDRDNDLHPQVLVDHYLHLVGRKITGQPRRTYSPWNRVNTLSRRLWRDPVAAGYLSVLLESFLELCGRWQQGRLSRSWLEGHMAEVLGQAFDRAAAGAGVDCLVLDQAVPARRLHLAGLVPPSPFVVVHRDPRDQFAEVQKVVQRQQGHHPKWHTASSFAEVYRADREAAARRIKRIIDRGYQVITVAFEDFVCDHDRESRRLLQALGLEDRSVADGEVVFDAEVSRKNVGKHAWLLSPDDRAVITAALPEFLHGEAG